MENVNKNATDMYISTHGRGGMSCYSIVNAIMGVCSALSDRDVNAKIKTICPGDWRCMGNEGLSANELKNLYPWG